MEFEPLDRELENERKEPKVLRRISGIVRFSLILYVIGLLVIGILSFKNRMLLFFMQIILWSYASLYNLNQGKYELSDKPIINKSIPRYASIIALGVLILEVIISQILNSKIGIFDDLNYLEPVIVILLSIYIIYRDLIQIPQEIKTTTT